MNNMEILLHVHDLCVTVGDGLCYYSEHPMDEQVKADINSALQAIKPHVNVEVMEYFQSLFSSAAEIGPEKMERKVHDYLEKLDIAPALTAVNPDSGEQMPAQKKTPRSTSVVFDREFASLIEACAASETEKLFYRMRKDFQKLPAQIRQQQIDYLNRYPLWGSFRPDRNDFGVLEEKAKSLTVHASDYAWLYSRLADFRSKKLLYGILRNWACFDFQTLGSCTEHCFDDYFDPDVLQCGPDEVVVDLGAYIGDTVISYVRTYGSFRRYYCYEISPITMAQLKKNTESIPNISYVQKGVGECAGTMYLSSGDDLSANALSHEAGNAGVAVKVVALDDDITEPITLLKMDIEGAEQSAIKGAARHIQRDRPKMALSVYHNNEDLWKVPRMVDDLCPGCRFYLRYHGGNLWPTEISLLAVPE